MAEQKGFIKFGIELDTIGFDKGLQDTARKLDSFSKAANKSTQTKINVTPTGGRELDAAGKSAEGLTKGLDAAGKAAKSLTTPAGFSRSVEEATKASRSLSDELSKASIQADGLSSSSKGLLSLEGNLGRVAKTAQSLAPALGAAAVASQTLTTGWKRLTSIDDAAFKLRGLGHTAETTAGIMDSAMAAVKGTAYGFGDAASLAAGAVAATGAEGERLTQILTTIADVAAISGRDLSDVGQIFNTVAASGRLMGSDLNRLMDAGIPVLNMLADELGVTAGEVRSLASESKISFATFEAAMRHSMGGAAKEMGGSITGALSNVNAALSRLGAEALSGGFNALPPLLGGVTTGIDKTTAAVTTLTDWFGRIPGPVKTMAAAILAANAAGKALDSTLGQKLVDTLKSAGDLSKRFGASVTAVFSDIAAAYQHGAAPLLKVAENHKILGEAARKSAGEQQSAFGAIDVINRQIGYSFAGTSATVAAHMRGMATAVTTGAGAIINALGGPLNLAIAGATILITQLVKSQNAATKAQGLMAAATREAADAQRELHDAVVGTSGALNEQGITAAAKVAENQLTRLIKVGENYKNTYIAGWQSDFSIFDNLTVSKEIEERTKEVTKLRNEYKTLEKATKDLGYSTDDVAKIVAQGGDAYHQLITKLEGAGEHGENAANQLRGARNEIEKTIAAGRSADTTFIAIGDGMQQLADSSGDAASQLQGLRDALKAAGLIQSTATEAAAEYVEKLEQIKATAADNINLDAGLGATLVGDDGNLLVKTNENARALNKQLVDLRDSFFAAIEAGATANQSWDDSQETLQALADSFGLPIEEVQRLAESYGMIPDQVDLYLGVKGAGAVAGELATIHMSLQGLEEGAEINLGILDEEVVDVLQALGYSLEEMNNGSWQLTVGTNTEEVNADLVSLMEQLSTLGAQEINPTVLLDTTKVEGSALHAHEILSTINRADVSPEADLIIDKLLAGKDLTVAELGILSSYTATPVAELDNWRFMQELGLTTAQLDGFGMKHVAPTVGVRDEASGPLSSIKRWLDSIVEAGPVNIAVRAGNWVRDKFTGGYTGGRFIPGYTDGGYHPGYRLPGTGPGTGVTDGFLALDRYGMPVARLDANEWVINGASSEKYDRLLAAINQDSPGAIIAALAQLQAMATGGQLGSATTKGAVPATGVVTATLVADELAHIGQALETMGNKEPVVLEILSDPARLVLEELAVEIQDLPDGRVTIEAPTDEVMGRLANLSDQLFELGDTVVNPVVLLDNEALQVSVQQAFEIIGALGIAEPTPIASLVIDDLVINGEIARGELEFLAGMSPVPVADLNTSLLEAGVKLSEDNLRRVGDSKATSVVDADNTSAIENINSVLDALNRMPVERTIRIVAAGSAAATLGGLKQGGEVPGRQHGGRLPTTGPGTSVVDGILGVGSDGVPTAWVDAGEYVTRRSRTERFLATLEAINSGSVSDIVSALRSDLSVQGLATGGAVVSPESLLAFARGEAVNGQRAAMSLQGAPYVWGGVNWGDCSGAMSGLANMAVGRNAFGSRFATGNQREALAGMGFLPGLGDPATSFNIGWFNGGPWGGHTSGDIGGVAVEMGGGAGGQGKIGGAAAPASSSQYTDHAHLPLGELWAFDVFQSLPLMVGATRRAGVPRFETEGGRGVAPGGLGLALAQNLGGGVSHTGGDGVHLNNGTVIPYTGGRVYDRGGDWPTGTWGVNLSGATETVLNGPRRNDYLATQDMLPVLGRAAEAMEVTSQALGKLHPGVQKFVDKQAPEMVGALRGVAGAVTDFTRVGDPSSTSGATVRAIAGRVLDLDVLPMSKELSSILAAERSLHEERAAVETRALAAAEAEHQLAEARSEVTRLNSLNPSEIEDQEKHAADIKAATDNVTAAEDKLAEARLQQVENLDHIVLGDVIPGLNGAIELVDGLANQLSTMGGAGAAAGGMLPGVSQALRNIATAAGPAGMSLGMVFNIISTVISIAKTIYSIIEQFVDGILKAKTAVATAVHESVGAIAEWNQVIDEQRQTVSKLRQAVIKANMDMVAAQWDARQAQVDLGRAQLEGVKGVAEAEAKLAAERARQAKLDWYNYNDLSLAYDRLRWAQHDVIYGQLGDYVRVTPEILALQNEVLAAQLTGAASVHAAQLSSLEASFSLMEAQKLLARGQRDLTRATEEYQRMSGTAFGLSTPQAMVAQDIARLQAENAKLAGERDRLGTRLSSGLGRLLDWNGDGRIFGVIPVGSGQVEALNSSIEANNRAIGRLLQSGYAPEWDTAQRAEADRVLKQAANLFAAGKDIAGNALIQGSIWGDAQRALNENKVLSDIAAWEKAQQELADEVSDLQDKVLFEQQAQPLRELIAALKAGSSSAQYSADALREENPAVRKALEALAAFEGDTARALRDNKPIKQIVLVGDRFDDQAVMDAMKQLAGDGKEMDLRITKLEQPDRPTARDVMASRIATVR